MGLQLPDQSITVTGITTAAPSGADAKSIDLSIAYTYDVMRPDKWLVTAVVSSAPSDLFLWGLLAAGVMDDATDDLWGLHNDKYGVIKLGKLGTALAVGTHHFVVEDLGLYARLYFQRSAGAVNVTITPILKSLRGS